MRPRAFHLCQLKDLHPPGFRHLAPISTWDAPNALGATRPRVMTYIRKGYHLKLQARQSLDHPDLLWAVVNGVSILNCYSQPLTPDVLHYVTHLTPPPPNTAL
jgi:hypothetical protein